MKRLLSILLGLFTVSLWLCAQEESGVVTTLFNQHDGGVVEVEQLSDLVFRVSAVPNTGYSFVCWSDGITSAVREHTHTQDVTADVIYYAVFSRDADVVRPFGHVSVEMKNAGSLTSQPTFNLLATADDGAIFYAWNNGSTTSINEQQSRLSYSETEGKRIPFFVSTAGEVSLFYSQHEGGKVNAAGTGTIHEYSMTATPSVGYSFHSWSDGNTDNPRIYTHNTETSPYNDKTFYAVFAKNADILRADGSVAVSVNSVGTEMTAPTYSLSASPNEGAIFYIWNNGNENTTVSYVETEGQRIPFFVNNGGTVSIFYDQHPGGVVEASPTGTSLEYSILATPAEGYSFLKWADGVTSNPRVHLHNTNYAPYDDRKFYAVFTKDADLEYSGGHVEVEVDSPTQPSFTLSAISNNNVSCGDASFYIWNNGSNNSLISYVESEGQRKAYFTRANMLIYEKDETNDNVINVDPLECGYTLTAQPSYNYSFVYWEDDHTNTNPIRDVDYIEETYRAIFAMFAFKVGDDYYPTYAEAESAAISAGAPIELVNDFIGNVEVAQDVQIEGNNHTLGSLTIPLGKKLTLTDDLQVNNLYLQTTTASSSQLVNKEHLTCTNAYIDITLEANQSVASPDKWYAFSVPFEVDVENGIRRANAPEAACTSTTDYLVWEYDGTLRAATGNGWVKLYAGTLYPGKFYMIGIDGTQNTWRFAKKSGSALGGSNVVDLPAFTGSIIDRGWNAIGNGTLQYATASIPDIAFVQVYDNNMSTYLPKMLNATSFVVACPFFAQVEGENTMTLSASNETNPAALYAPRRMAMQEKNIYEVRLSKDDNYDILFISANEESSETYQIGKDLLKFGLNTSRPQVLTMNAGTMLCVEDRPFVNGAADFPIYILAPQAGDYELTVSDGNRSVYLLENGLPIADITGSTYTLRLSRGMVNSYSLRIGEKHDVPTGMDEQEMEADAQKVIYNNQLYIIRNQQIYDATGARVR